MPALCQVLLCSKLCWQNLPRPTVLAFGLRVLCRHITKLFLPLFPAIAVIQFTQSTFPTSEDDSTVNVCVELSSINSNLDPITTPIDVTVTLTGDPSDTATLGEKPCKQTRACMHFRMCCVVRTCCWLIMRCSLFAATQSWNK